MIYYDDDYLGLKISEHNIITLKYKGGIEAIDFYHFEHTGAVGRKDLLLTPQIV